MLRHSSIPGFALRAAIIYAVIATPWPGVRDATAWAYRVAGTTVFSSFGPRATVRFEAFYPPAELAIDTRMVIRTQAVQPPMMIHQPSSSRYMAVMPAAVFLALTLATPLPWKRRRRAVAIGAPLILLYIALRITVSILTLLSGEAGVIVYHITGIWQTILASLTDVLSTSLLGAIVPPIFIWILVTFRRGDLKQLTDPATTRDTRPD